MNEKRWYGRLFDGRLTTLLGLVLAGLAVEAALFATVQKDRELRGTDKIQVIMVWIQHGYLKHGGLKFLEPVDSNPTQRVWRSSSMGYMQSAHLVERIYVAFRGRPSYTLLAVHNQAVVMLASALLGLLAFRIVVTIGAAPPHALLMALATACVYQTFPSNLNAILSIYPTIFVLLGFISFLILELRGIGDETPPGWCAGARAATVFAMFYCDPITVGLFMMFYCLVSVLLAPEVHRNYRFLVTIAVPAALAVGVFALQLLWVRWRYPGIQLYGSSFMFRTGFDGATDYYRTHADLILSRFTLAFGPELLYLAQWWVLMVGGLIALVWVTVSYLRSRRELRGAVYVMIVALTMYLPFAFLFSQAAIIHPWEFDQYLTVPLVLALFAVLPTMLGRGSTQPAIFTLVSVIGAFCYCMVQLRMYATVYPVVGAIGRLR